MTRDEFAEALRVLPDVDIRRPLWEFTPGERPAVIHERRVRFGVDDDEGLEFVG